MLLHQADMAIYHGQRIRDRSGLAHLELALDREAGPAIFHVMADTQLSTLHRVAIDQPVICTSGISIAREGTAMRTSTAAKCRNGGTGSVTRPFLKMDTQGNYFTVVEGTGHALGAFVGLQSELASRKLSDGDVDFAGCIAAFSARGFERSSLRQQCGHFPVDFEIDCVNRRAKPLGSPEGAGPGC